MSWVFILFVGVHVCATAVVQDSELWSCYTFTQLALTFTPDLHPAHPHFHPTLTQLTLTFTQFTLTFTQFTPTFTPHFHPVHPQFPQLTFTFTPLTSLSPCSPSLSPSSASPSSPPPAHPTFIQLALSFLRSPSPSSPDFHLAHLTFTQLLTWNAQLMNSMLFCCPNCSSMVCSTWLLSWMVCGVIWQKSFLIVWPVFYLLCGFFFKLRITLLIVKILWTSSGEKQKCWLDSGKTIQLQTQQYIKSVLSGTSANVANSWCIQSTVVILHRLSWFPCVILVFVCVFLQSISVSTHHWACDTTACTWKSTDECFTELLNTSGHISRRNLW